MYNMQTRQWAQLVLNLGLYTFGFFNSYVMLYLQYTSNSKTHMYNLLYTKTSELNKRDFLVHCADGV